MGADPAAKPASLTLHSSTRCSHAGSLAVPSGHALAGSASRFKRKHRPGAAPSRLGIACHETPPHLLCLGRRVVQCQDVQL